MNQVVPDKGSPAASYAPIKLHYLIAYGILGAAAPYVPLFLKERGFSESEVGWIFGLQGVAVIFAPGLFAALADRWFSNRALIALCHGLSAVALLGLASSHTLAAAMLTSLTFSVGMT
ncbi:MAG: MFS transporter, partial [Planctomycetales bacterium]